MPATCLILQHEFSKKPFIGRASGRNFFSDTAFYSHAPEILLEFARSCQNYRLFSWYFVCFTHLYAMAGKKQGFDEFQTIDHRNSSILFTGRYIFFAQIYWCRKSGLSILIGICFVLFAPFIYLPTKFHKL